MSELININIDCFKNLPIGKSVRMDKAIPMGEDNPIDVIVWRFTDRHNVKRIGMFDVRNGFYLGDTV